MSEFASEYDDAKASGGGGLPNGDHLWKITSVEYQYKTDKMTTSAIRIGLSLYSDLDGNDLTSSDFDTAFVYFRPGKDETDGQRKARMANLGRLKQLVFSFYGKEVEVSEFEEALQSQDMINEIVGIRTAWITRYNDPSKSTLHFDKFFVGKKIDGEYQTFDGKLVGEYTDTSLSKYARDRLFVAGQNQSSGSYDNTGSTAPDDLDDEIPF